MKELTVEHICDWIACDGGINDDIVCEVLNDDEVEGEICSKYCGNKFPIGRCYLRYFKKVLGVKENE